ncbi:MAG TPA: hypothetical protein VL523_19635 [Terriglobia bacterium]|nr:hypothetical protein [Terriglobia bacterium]
MSHSREFETAPGGISKRAAQRLIQRALVLAGRSRIVHQHIREADLTSVWVIEDWRLAWAVTIRRGELDFDRRLPRRPDIRVSWATAAAFFGEGETPTRNNFQPQYEGPAGARRTWDVVQRAFQSALRELLQNPIDGDGRSLV